MIWKLVVALLSVVALRAHPALSNTLSHPELTPRRHLWPRSPSAVRDDVAPKQLPDSCKYYIKKPPPPGDGIVLAPSKEDYIVWELRFKSSTRLRHEKICTRMPAAFKASCHEPPVLVEPGPGRLVDGECVVQFATRYALNEGWKFDQECLDRALVCIDARQEVPVCVSPPFLPVVTWSFVIWLTSAGDAGGEAI